MITSHLLNCWFLLLHWIAQQSTKRRKYLISSFTTFVQRKTIDVPKWWNSFIYLSLTLLFQLTYIHSAPHWNLCRQCWFKESILEELYSHIKCISANCYRTWRVPDNLYKLIFEGFILSVNWTILSAAL